MTEPTLDFLTVEQAAEILHMPARTVVRLLKEGSLPGIYAGTRAGWRIRRSDLTTWTTNLSDASQLAPTRRRRPTTKQPKQPKDNA